VVVLGYHTFLNNNKYKELVTHLDKEDYEEGSIKNQQKACDRLEIWINTNEVHWSITASEYGYKLKNTCNDLIRLEKEFRDLLKHKNSIGYAPFGLLCFALLFTIVSLILQAVGRNYSKKSYKYAVSAKTN